MTPITGEEVKAAAIKAGIREVEHHKCSICHAMVYYRIADDGFLTFHPACGCSWSSPEARTWESAANWINMQSEPGHRANIMAKFGIAPEPA